MNENVGARALGKGLWTFSLNGFSEVNWMWTQWLTPRPETSMLRSLIKQRVTAKGEWGWQGRKNTTKSLNQGKILQLLRGQGYTVGYILVHQKRVEKIIINKIMLRAEYQEPYTPNCTCLCLNLFQASEPLTAYPIERWECRIYILVLNGQLEVIEKCLSLWEMSKL